MYPAVIGKRHRGCKVVPVILPCCDIPTKGSQNSPVVTFDLPVSLGVISSRKDFLDSQFGANSLEELSSELRTVIG